MLTIAIIWSNNADGYPHIDLGLEKTETGIGDVEFRFWWGLLKTSEYYEPAPSSYEDFISGISVSYAPSFIPGLTLGFHKTAQILMDDMDWYSPFKALDPGFINPADMGKDHYDGRASVTWSWLSPSLGLECYGEWAREDYSTNWESWIETPEHASGFTLGFKKIIDSDDTRWFWLLNGEISSLVWSMDYYIDLGWGGGFYRHGYTTGYTNNGQVLGAGYGSGGNRQHLELDYYGPFGMAGLFFTRTKYDDVELYYEDQSSEDVSQHNIPVLLALGTRAYVHLNQDISLGGSLVYLYEENRNLESDNDIHGFSISLSLNYYY